MEGTSPNTRRTYQTALLYWGAWYALRYGRVLTAPVSVPTVIQFILDHLEHNPLRRARGALAVRALQPHHPTPAAPAIDRVLVARAYKAKLGPWSRATVETRLAALSRAHDVFIANQIPPLPAAGQSLARPRRKATALCGAPGLCPAAAGPRAPAGHCCDATGDGSAPGHLPGRPGGNPGPGAAALWVCERRTAPIGDRGGDVGKRPSRRPGRICVRTRAIEDQPVRGQGAAEHSSPSWVKRPMALEAWLNELFRAKITEGAIFRRIHNGRITEPLRDQAVWSIVRSRAKLVDPPLGKLTAHSLRSGFVTESGRQNIPIGEAMALTGHRACRRSLGTIEVARWGILRPRG